MNEHMNEVITTNQSYLFLIYFICGFSIGMFFDIFRILRRAFKTTDLLTYIQDVIFLTITGIFLIFMLFVFNNGQLRAYIFFAIIGGLALYMLVLSKYFIKLNVRLLLIVKKIILKIVFIILYPFKILITPIKKVIEKIILKPFRILTINIGKINMTKKVKNRKNAKKNKTKSIEKKDF